MLEVYSLNDPKWDEIVKTFKDYDVYYLSEYTKGFMIHGDGEPLLFYYKDNDIKAINVVMKRDISFDNHFSNIEKNKYFDFSTPYGYGGWLIEGDGNLDDLMSHFFTWCKENNIISEIVRFHPILANQEKLKDFYEIVDLKMTISMDLTSEENVWTNLTSKNRNVIRKAIKNNVEIKCGFNEELISSFKEIYNQTMSRDNADNYYYFNDDFYQSILIDLKEYATIFYALYKNTIISSSIILKTNNKLNYHLSGSLKEYGNLAASNLLLYEVAKWGVQNGYKSFHLGGGVGSKEDNLFAFKKAFNKKSDYQYCIGKKIFNKEIYDKLVEMRKDNAFRENYFPKYRA